jgi:uncharacterized alkaline shock family protein YloU
VPAGAPPGRSLVTRRAVIDLVRAAALGSYGVTGFGHRSAFARVAAALHLGPAGIRVRLQPAVELELWLTVAFGLPIAEVARQVDSAVRYAIRRGTGREVDSLVIHVNRLRVVPAAPPSPPPAPDATVGRSTPPGEPAQAVAVAIPAGPAAPHR